MNRVFAGPWSSTPRSLRDYDAAQKAHLFTLEKNGQQTPAIGHANKSGFYFILDRRDGKPLVNVKETSVPVDPAWQHASPTQPIPATDVLIPQSVDKTPSGTKSAPLWTPPQEQPFLIQPGFEAGPNYPPAAYSPRTKYAYIGAGGYEPWLYHAIPPQVNSLASIGIDTIPGSTITDLSTPWTPPRAKWRGKSACLSVPPPSSPLRATWFSSAAPTAGPRCIW